MDGRRRHAHFSGGSRLGGLEVRPAWSSASVGVRDSGLPRTSRHVPPSFSYFYVGICALALGSNFVFQAYEPTFVSIPTENRYEKSAPEASDELKTKRKVTVGGEHEGEDDEMVDVKAITDSA